MHLLFIESNPESARSLHSEFLDYRGVNWSLTHCETYREAIELLDQGSFQSILYSNDCSYEQTLLEINELLRTGNCPPLVATASNLSAHEGLNLVVDGTDDCFNRSEVTGAGLMRQLRMAEMRKAVYSEQATMIAAGRVDGTSADQLLQEAANHRESDLGDTIHRQLRIAHVACRSNLIDQFQFVSDQLIVSRYHQLGDLLKDYGENVQECDAMVIEQSVFEQAPESDIGKLERYLAVVPGVVLTMEKSDFSALSYLERGYSECLVVDDMSSNSLIVSVRKSVIRRRRGILNSLRQQNLSHVVSDRRAIPRNSINRRRHVRFNINQPITAIPVLPNGAPDLEGQCNAVATNVSLKGIGVTMLHHDRLPRKNWVIGVEQANGSIGYTSAHLRNVAYNEGKINSGMVFHNDPADVLHSVNLWPQPDPENLRLTTRTPAQILDQWVAIGVLQKHAARRAQTCPDCEAICTVGTGCSQCGGFDLKFQDLVHHFACAHVDHAARFESEGSIQCPKCLSDNLVAGADFEVIRSRYECQSCCCESDQTAAVGCCLNCQLRFPLEIAPEIEVHGYDVERLDVLAFVDAARHAATTDSAAADF